MSQGAIPTTDRRAVSPRPFAVVGFLILVASVFVTVMLGGSARWLLVGAWACVAGAQLALLRRVTRERVPFVAVLVLGLDVVGVLGYFFYKGLQETAQVSAQIPADGHLYRSAALTFAVASIATTAGALLGALRTRPDRDRADSIAVIAATTRRLGAGPGLAIAAVPLLLVVFGFTPAFLWDRSNYLIAAGPHVFVSAGFLFTPVGLGIISVILFGENRRGRLGALVLLAAYSVTYFAVGSRGIALIPPLLLLGYIVGSQTKRTRVGPVRLAACCVLTVFLFQLPLSIRSTSGTAGLRPFTSHLLNDPSAFLVSGPGPAVGNILFALPLAGFIEVDSDPIPRSLLVTSVNPLPGSFTNWNSVRNQLRVNAFTPYSGLGELANYGRVYVALLFFVIGLVFTLLQRSAHRLRDGPRVLLTLAGPAMTALLALDMLQYNLRTGVRLVWYLIAGTVVLVVTSWHQTDR